MGESDLLNSLWRYEMFVGNAPFYSPNIQQMYNNIQFGNLEIPTDMDDAMQDLVKQVPIHLCSTSKRC